MKILILANRDLVLYNFRKELIKRLLRDGHSVLIALPGGDRVVDMMKMGCSYRQVEIVSRGMNPFKDVKIIKAYFTLIRDIKPDLVLSYTIKPNIYGGIVCQIMKKRYIASITGLSPIVKKKSIAGRLILRFYEMGLRGACCVFFQNEANLRTMNRLKLRTGKVRLVPGSGVNLDEHKLESYPEETADITFLFLGRLIKAKGVEELFSAARQIKSRYPDVVFQIAGACEDDYAEQLKQYEEEGIIRYLGFQREVRTLIKKCSAVVLPSHHEGMSNALLEASACGRPVVASRIPGCQEIFTDGITGFGVEPGNAKSLEDALAKFIELPYEEKKEMGLLARKKVKETFDREIVTAAYMEEINQLMEENNGALQ